ncbi:hypothetical protein [Methylobacterium sp. JK268]
MKAANQDRVVLLGLDGTPWAVALGRDAKAEHEHGCLGLLDWLGIGDEAITVADVCCRPRPTGPDWALCEPDDPRAATVLGLNSAEAGIWRTKRHALKPKHVQSDGDAFYGACQEDDALVTAWDDRSAALAAFRPVDRKLVRDIAEAVRTGRLVAFDGGAVGPILVLADRISPDVFCQAIAEAALVVGFDDDGSGIAYAERSVRSLETCTVPQSWP